MVATRDDKQSGYMVASESKLERMSQLCMAVSAMLMVVGVRTGSGPMG